MIHQLTGSFFGLDLITDSQAFLDAVAQGHASFDAAFPEARRAVARCAQELVSCNQSVGLVTYLNGHVRAHPPVGWVSPGSAPHPVALAPLEDQHAPS